MNPVPNTGERNCLVHQSLHIRHLVIPDEPGSNEQRVAVEMVDGQLTEHAALIADLETRVDAIEARLTALFAEKDRRARASPTTASAREPSLTQQQLAALAQVTHEPINGPAPLLRTAFTWTGNNPQVIVRQLTGTVVRMTVRGARLASGLPAKGELTHLVTRQMGSSLVIEYGHRDGIAVSPTVVTGKATLDLQVGTKGRIGIVAHGGTSGAMPAAQPSQVVVQQPAYVRPAFLPRFSVAAIMPDSAVVRAPNGELIPVFVGSTIEGYGAVLEFFPNVTQIRTEGGIISGTAG